MEIPYKEQMYTWFNKKENGLIKEKLDKALVNLLWEKTFPCSQLHLLTIGSDHSPILVNSDFHDQKTPRRFKFEIIWVEIEGCMVV